MTDDPKYDDAELAEAEALARALERGHAPPSSVDDAVDAADVVRMLKAPLLHEDRLEATLAETTQRIAAARRRSRARLFALGAAGGALAMAAAAMLIVRGRSFEPSPHSAAPVAVSATARQPQREAPQAPAGLAAPGLAREGLIQAQIAMLEAPSSEARDALEHALSNYRYERLSEIEQHYRQEATR